MSALDDLSVFREYEPRELGRDGYPLAWHDLGAGRGIKHIVREAAGDRCVRCGHPFIVGQSSIYEEGDDLHARRTERETGFRQAAVDLAFEGMVADGGVVADPQGARRTNWSPCDVACWHHGPYRWRLGEGYPWTHVEEGDEPGRISAAGIAQGVEIQAAWRILTVHHLTEVKSDCRWWNLAALCQRCHLTIQRKVTMELPWPWEHSDWFRPHAAAWYALKFLGEHLTYSETMARLDELLELGQREEATERMAL